MPEKHPIIYAFIDSQNLNLGVGKDIYRNKKCIYKGWRLDYKKFRIYLRNKFHVQKAVLFIGYVPSNKQLYNQLKSYGYTLVFKPTTKDGHGKFKGNVDAELVLHVAAVEYRNYDKAVIVSGDGDFYCLYKYLIQYQKLLNIVIPNTKSESSLLKDLHSYKIFVKFDREKIEFKTKKMGGVAV